MTQDRQIPIAKSGSALALSQMGLMLFNFIYTIYVVRFLSKPEYAVIAVLEIMFMIFSFSDMGLLEVASQQAPSALRRDGDETRALALMKCAFRYRTIALLLIGAIAVILAPYISSLLLKTTDYTWAIILLIPGAVARIVYETLLGIGRISDNYYPIAQWDFIGGILRIVLSILALLIFGFTGFLVGIVASIFIQVIGLGWRLRKYLFNDVKAAPFWPTFRYGIPFYTRSFFRFGYLQYDLLVVGAFLNPAALAGYSVARRFTKFIFLITESFQSPITYRLAELRNEPDRMQGSFFIKATRYITFIVVPLSILIVVLSPWLMQVLGGIKYKNDWPLLAIMALAQAAYAFYAVYAAAVFSRLKPKASLVLDGIVGGINFIAAPLLVIYWGKFGVAWGQILGFGIGITCALYLLRSLHVFKYDRSSLRLLVIPLSIAGSIIVIGQITYFQWWSVPVYAVIAGFAFILFMGRRLRDDDWEQIHLIVPSIFTSTISRVQKFFKNPQSENDYQQPQK